MLTIRDLGELKMKSQFIKRLNSILQKRNLSQADLSKMTGIRSSSISDWLNGKYEPKQDKIAFNTYLQNQQIQ